MGDERSDSEYSRAMVVVAHPDDAEYGCSGTVAKWCRLGWEVVYVLCSDGSKGTEDRSISSAELIEIRRQEQIEAGKILGLKGVAFLGYPDGYLEPTLNMRRDITRQIRMHRPDILVTTNPTRDISNGRYIGHPDHFAAGEAAFSAVFPSARDHLTFPELLEDEGLEPHKVSELWMMMYSRDRADRYSILEEADVEKSIRALVAHASQIGDPDKTREMMKKWRARTGERIGVDYAETFKVFKLS